MIKFLDLKSQYNIIKGEVDDAVASILSTANFIGGSELKKFESEFASFLGVKHCIGVGNGTDALELAIEALDLPQGSEILVPANSFIASSEAVSRCGHKVVFVDVSEATLNLCIDDFNKKITANTRAVMVVHLYGNPCDMDQIKDICYLNDIIIIEDCAQAHGAMYKNQAVGSIGKISCFSFYPGKNLGAYGDGGCVVTNDPELAEKVRKLSNHGRTKKYEHEFEGRNSRLDTLQAAILSVKLKHLPSWTDKRIELAERYRLNLQEVEALFIPEKTLKSKHVYHLFVVALDNRDGAREYLNKNGIECGVHYPFALPQLEAYQDNFKHNQNMVACKMSSKLLSLPIGEHLEIKDIDIISATLKQFISNPK